MKSGITVSNMKKIILKKIQIEAARIATGTTKLVSIASLYSEIGWNSLDTRRKMQKLVLFYKMVNHLTPLYLSSLIPPTVNETSRYNLRNANNISTINARTNQYFNSFLPSTIRDWNRNSTSVASFKHTLNQTNISVPKYFYVGDRRPQVLHTRLRTKCSALNYEICLKNLTDTPLCRCGNIENSEHFFLQCRYYHRPKKKTRNDTNYFSTLPHHLRCTSVWGQLTFYEYKHIYFH